MNKNLQDTINNIFGEKPSANQKAWGIINQFYHLVLVKMEEEKISRADLARNLGKSRAAISQMFNKSPNISIKKMIEIAEAVNLNINLTSDFFVHKNEIKEIKKFVYIPVNNFEEEPIDIKSKTIRYDNNMKSSYTVKCCGF